MDAARRSAASRQEEKKRLTVEFQEEDQRPQEEQTGDFCFDSSFHFEFWVHLSSRHVQAETGGSTIIFKFSTFITKSHLFKSQNLYFIV